MVLVTGTWNKRALAEFIFFSIYKNIFFVFVQVIFSLIDSDFLGEKLVYSNKNNQMFNVLYTSLPSMATGLFYAFYSAEDIIRSPSIYQVRLPSMHHLYFQYYQYYLQYHYHWHQVHHFVSLI